jgi:hypothetical protein
MGAWAWGSGRALRGSGSRQEHAARCHRRGARRRGGRRARRRALTRGHGVPRPCARGGGEAARHRGGVDERCPGAGALRAHSAPAHAEHFRDKARACSCWSTRLRAWRGHSARWASPPASPGAARRYPPSVFALLPGCWSAAGRGNEAAHRYLHGAGEGRTWTNDRGRGPRHPRTRRAPRRSPRGAASPHRHPGSISRVRDAIVSRSTAGPPPRCGPDRRLRGKAGPGNLGAYSPGATAARSRHRVTADSRHSSVRATRPRHSRKRRTRGGAGMRQRSASGPDRARPRRRQRPARSRVFAPARRPVELLVPLSMSFRAPWSASSHRDLEINTAITRPRGSTAGCRDRDVPDGAGCVRVSPGRRPSSRREASLELAAERRDREADALARNQIVSTPLEAFAACTSTSTYSRRRSAGITAIPCPGTRRRWPESSRREGDEHGPGLLHLPIRDRRPQGVRHAPTSAPTGGQVDEKTKTRAESDLPGAAAAAAGFRRVPGSARCRSSLARGQRRAHTPLAWCRSWRRPG